MKIHLENGKIIRVNRGVANAIAKQKGKLEEGDLLTFSDKGTKNVRLMFDVNKVIAIS